MSRETSPRAEHVLMRVRASADPARGVAAHVFAGIEQRLALEGDAAAHASSAGAGPGELAASRASRWQNVARVAVRLGRWGGFGLLTGVIGYQLGVASHEHQPPSASPASVPRVASAAVPAPALAPAQEMEPARRPSASTPAVVLPPEAPRTGENAAGPPSSTPRTRSGATPMRAPRARLAARAGTSALAATSSGAQPLSMTEILERLKRAQSALRDGDPHAALAELDTLDSIDHGGALADERLVLRSLALCDLGRVGEARHVLAALDGRGAESIYRGRLEQSCAAALAR
jgi:hypothetical protein